MLAATYHPSFEVHAIAQVLLFTAVVIALCMVPVLITAIVPVITLVLVAVVKTIIVAALAASPLLIIKIQKGYRL